LPDVLQNSAPRWVSFQDIETGDTVHLSLVLFRTLQPGRHLAYVREALVVEQETVPEQIEFTPEFSVDDEPEPA
jgi:hypothetical protein